MANQGDLWQSWELQSVRKTTMETEECNGRRGTSWMLSQEQSSKWEWIIGWTQLRMYVQQTEQQKNR